ncbi:E3 ubiquitin-protein ligase TRIM11-like isoform X2 [Mauremys mutica]|uniref:E3 ubiquitin-protein ligase TRIM11-like isoform X2 n=1 Tax=Mauremys mutica TaxID=74926 RepID=UPI001D16D80B|nr:E3 ubiquitin-protein ligase TRIM11-like isoform X2 [Mauremys mutica]
MAAATPAQLLLAELTCSVCLDYFKDPVSLACGHHFCQACITQCWEGLSADFPCPECRETFSRRNLKPNRQLRNIVDASRKLTLESAKEPDVETVCDKHKENLKVFCQKDQTLICVVCHLSQDHKGHPAVLIEEAAEDYKKQIRSRLESLKKESEEILTFKLSGENKSPELLDIKGTLSRCEREKFQNSGAFSSDLKWRLWESSQRNASLETIVQKFKDSLSSRQRLDKANVTLDPHTAHPQLIVSADRKSVRLGCTRQDLPDNPERFDPAPCVLGCEGFTSGRHYWEVEGGAGGVCDVGVARASVSRKGRISLNSEQGVWAVESREDQYWAHTSPEQRIRFPPSSAPRRIRVYLDYEQGQVSFFNAGTGDPIVTFPPASFAGERIRPFFGAVGSSARLTLCP